MDPNIVKDHDDRRKLAEVLVKLAPLAGIYSTASVAGNGPGSIVDLRVRWETLESMAEGLRDLKVMIYGKTKDEVTK